MVKHSCVVRILLTIQLQKVKALKSMKAFFFCVSAIVCLTALSRLVTAFLSDLTSYPTGLRETVGRRYER